MDRKYRTIKGMNYGGLAARAEGAEKVGNARKVGSTRKKGNVEKVGNAFCLWLGSRRNRILVAILAGMLAASGVSGDLSAFSHREQTKTEDAFASGAEHPTAPGNTPTQDVSQDPSPSLTAWWGSLYPKFCYAETPEHETSSSHPVKISFRLAELFK